MIKPQKEKISQKKYFYLPQGENPSAGWRHRQRKPKIRRDFYFRHFSISDLSLRPTFLHHKLRLYSE